MAQLTAKFKMIDEISDKLSNIANNGQKMLDEFERLSGYVNSFDDLSASAQGFLDIVSNMSSNISLSMRDITSSADKAEDSVNNIAESLNNLNSNLDNASESSENYDESLNNTVESLNGLAAAGEDLIGSFEDLIAAAEEATQRVSDYGERSDKAGDQSEDFGEKSVNAIESLAQIFISTGIEDMAQNLLGCLIECSDTAGQFEVSMAKVASIADTSKMPIDEISASIKELSSETGKSVEDISEATYQAISASVDTASAVDFVGTANKLSAGGFTEAATAVDVLTTALNAYKLDGSEACKISDMLITTQNLGKTSVDELAASIGKVIPIASAYNVEMDNLSSAYALLTAGGIATAETGTYLKAMLNELGGSGSAVAEVLMEETGRSFAELMASGRSLGEVIEILGNSVNNNNTAFSELWSSSEAKMGALSLLSSGAEKFNDVLGEMRNSTGATEKAYRIMTDTTVYAQEKMSNAFQNLKIVVGDQLNPTLEKLYNSLASAFGWIGDCLEDNPEIVAKITSIAVGVGVFAAAVGGASAAMAIFNAICKMNPIILITSLVIAATAAIGTFIEILYNQNEYTLLTSTAKNQCDQIREMNSEYEEACRLSDEHSKKAQNLSMELNKLTESYESQNITSENQDNQIQKLNAEYEEACRLSEENSEKAKNLKKEIDELTEAYESQKMTMEEFLAVQKELTDTHNEWYNSYISTSKELGKESKEAAFLIDMLNELSAVTNKTVAEKEEMAAVILELNKRMPDLDISYDSATGSIDKSIKDIRDYLNAEMEKAKKENQYTAYINAKFEADDLDKGLDDLKKEAKAFGERMSSGDYLVKSTGFLGTWRVLGETFEISDQIEAQRNAVMETQQVLYSCNAAWAEQERAARAAAEAPVSYGEAVERTVNSVSENLDELAKKYDEAYEAAKESLSNQYDLFEKIEVKAGISSSSMFSIWEQQKEVFSSYKENLDKLSSYNINVDFLKELNDGSVESMGQVSQLVKEFEKLNPEKAAEFANKINEEYKSLIETRDETAKSMSDIEEDLAGNLEDIEKNLKNSIENMNMSKEAEEAAKATITAYIQNIKSMTREAESAAAGIATATAAALASGKIHTVQEDSDKNVGIVSVVSTVAQASGKIVQGNANGTTNAEDIFIAGEEGPELIVGKAGSTVFPTKETDKIISALDTAGYINVTNNYTADTIATAESGEFNAYDTERILTAVKEKPLRTEVPESFETRTEQSNYNYNETKSEKKIILEINGSGSIDMGDSFDEERAVNFMYANIKPVLLDIFRTEKYEEGEASYVF